MKRAFMVSSLLCACAIACGSDEGTGLGTPPAEVRNAPSTVVISGISVGVTGFAYREYSSAGMVLGETRWTARVVSAPGVALPSVTVVELWYVMGTSGKPVPITSSRLVTDATDPFLEVQGTGGQINPGSTADVVVRLRDASGTLFLIRTTGVPVQRYERLD